MTPSCACVVMWTRCAVEDLFDRQIVELQRRGLTGFMIDQLARQRHDVVRVATGMTFAADHLPLVPVISRHLNPLRSQMTLLRRPHENWKHGVYCDPHGICNRVPTAAGCYFLFDVEDGTATRGDSASQAKHELALEGRACLTIEELLALDVQTGVLDRHNVMAAACHYNGNPYFVPTLCVDPREPEIRITTREERHPAWGIPSCAGRSE